jgi:group I intron endonuclease
LQSSGSNKHLVLKTGFVYKWINVSNNKWYIGSHCGKITDSYIGSGKAFLASYKKNPSFFIREIIYDGVDFREVEELILQTLNAAEDRNSYNLKNSAIGGDTSMHFTEESRKKMSDASKSTKGKRFFSKEHREKISNTLKGRKLPDEVCKKISERMTGELNPFFGKSHSKETREKISISKMGQRPSKDIMDSLHKGNMKKVYCSLNDMTFDSINETAKFFGKTPSYISNMINGRCNNNYGLYKNIQPPVPPVEK